MRIDFPLASVHGCLMNANGDGEKMPIIAREPGARRPGVLRMVHHDETFHHVAGALAVIPTPAGGLAVSAPRAGTAFRVRQDSPIKRRYLRDHPQRKEGVL